MSNISSNFTSQYCSGLESTYFSYMSIHGYVSISVCIAGALNNILALAVLTTRPELPPTTTTILSALAASDVLLMLEYIPFALHMYIHTSRARHERYSYSWAIYVLFHAYFTQIFHTISIWITVTLAVWRYLAVYHSDKSREWCTIRGTKIAVIAAYLGSPLLCVPIYFAFFVTQTPDGVYIVNLSEMARANNNLLININFWLYSVVLKLLPCFLLTFLSQRLIAALLENKKRRRVLLNKADKDGERTSRLLAAVLILFLITELPQGILGLLSVIIGEEFFNSCYKHLGEFMDVFALTTSALNFPLYCIMCSQFRIAFTTLLRKFCCLKQVHRPHRSPETYTTVDEENKKTTTNL